MRRSAARPSSESSRETFARSVLARPGNGEKSGSAPKSAAGAKLAAAHSATRISVYRATPSFQIWKSRYFRSSSESAFRSAARAARKGPGSAPASDAFRAEAAAAYRVPTLAES
jgi:hypothetical protein